MSTSLSKILARVTSLRQPKSLNYDWLSASVDGLSQKFADVKLSGSSDERKVFVHRSQKGGPISDGQGQALSESSLDRDRYMGKARKGESASKATIPSHLVKARRRRPEIRIGRMSAYIFQAVSSSISEFSP